MRLQFHPRPDGQPLEQLADGFIFLSGGIFQVIDRVGMAAEQHGYAGKVRIEVVARDLVEGALAPLASQYDAPELERAASLLGDAITCVGRAFFSDQPVGKERLRASA